MVDHEPRELPNELTKVTANDLGGALVRAWQHLWQETPRRETILVLLAQSALETGRWRSCHCWNLGNIKSRPGDGRDWTFFRCNEVENGHVVWYDPPHPACRFRAFRTLEEGAVDHLAFLRGMKRYAAAWPMAIAGDPRGFVAELKRAGYFTASLEPYATSVASIYHAFDRELSFEIPPIVTAPPEDVALDDEERQRIMGRVALSLRDLSDELAEDRIRDTEPPPPEGNA